MVTVRFGRWLATLEAGSWSAPGSKALEGALNELHPNGVSTAWPDPDLRMAEEAIVALGGEILENVPQEVEDPPKGAVY